MLLDNLYVLDFSYLLHTYWPVIFIALGISLLLKRQPSGPWSSGAGSVGAKEAAPFGSRSDSQRIISSTVFGDYRVAIDSKSFTGGNVSTTFGNTEIDLVNARLAEGEHVLELNGVFGNTWVRLPADIAFAVFANTTFGDVRINERKKAGVSSSLDYSTPDYHLARSRIRILVSCVFGNVTVVSNT
jgi:predicted membrane protein